MKKELISSFKNLETNKELRTAITPTGNILFCLSDVCDNLNLTNPSMTKKALEREYGKDLSFSYPLSTSGGEQLFTFIPESHVYFLVFRSTKEEARKFRNWVTEDILPSLRKTGSYTINSSYPVSPYTPELLAKIKKLEEEKEEIKNELKETKQELNGVRQELNIRPELISFSKVADYYNMDEPTLKLILEKLGVDLDKVSFSNKDGDDTYIDKETYSTIRRVLSINFCRAEDNYNNPNITFTELLLIKDNLPF